MNRLSAIRTRDKEKFSTNRLKKGKKIVIHHINHQPTTNHWFNTILISCSYHGVYSLVTDRQTERQRASLAAAEQNLRQKHTSYLISPLSAILFTPKSLNLLSWISVWNKFSYRREYTANTDTYGTYAGNGGCNKTHEKKNNIY